MNTLYTPEILVKYSQKDNSPLSESLSKEYIRFTEEVLPTLWKGILPDFLKKSSYFTFAFYKEFMKSERDLLLILGLETLDSEELEDILPLTTNVRDYILTTAFDDWLIPSPENISLYDKNKKILLRTITHEYIIELQMSEEEKVKYENTYQIKFVPSTFGLEG